MGAILSPFTATVVTLAPSGDTTGATDQARLAAALAALPVGGGLVQLGRGTYYLTGSLTLPTGTTLVGAGINATTINQLSTTADTLTATDQRGITLRDFGLNGPASGTGRGVALLFSASPVANISMENLFIRNFGGDGVALGTPIASVISNVRSEGNGGNGFTQTGGTSVTWNSCYANANTVNGFEIDSANYSSLNGCAADGCVIGYSINGSSAIVMTGCGSETCATGFKVLGAAANISMNGCKVFTETSIGFWITGNSVFCFVIGCREASPNGATASFQVDAGSAAMVINPQNTTATNYAAGTTNLFQPTNFEVHSSGNTVARMSRGATSNTGRYTLQTANSDRWTMQLNSDSTDNLYVSDLQHSTTGLALVSQATAPNLALLTSAGSFGGGVGVIFIVNASTLPASNPSGGGILYVNAGALTYRGSSGTVTPIASA